MKKLLTTIILSFLSVGVFAQTGFYRSVVAGTGDWSDINSWEYSSDNVTWATIVAEGYPGQLGVPTSVLVRDNGTIVLDVTPANNIGALTVGEGVSGSLYFGNDATIRGLVVNAAVTIAGGATINANSNAIHTLSVGSNFTIDGTFNGFTSATQAVNVTFAGTAGNLSGSGTVTFNSLTINRTGTTNITANFQIHELFSIINTGTVNAGTQTITGAGGSDTFSMTTGIFQIGGSNSFPSGFETITLSGGTVEYNGNTNQTITHLDGSSNPLIYNNLTLSIGGTKTAAGGLIINGTLDYSRPIDMGGFVHRVRGSWIQRGSQAHTTSGTVILDGGAFQQINNPVNGTAIQFNNLTVENASVISVNSGQDLIVNGTMSMIANSSMTVATNLRVRGNYSVQAGSSLTHTGGSTIFDGTTAQAIDLNNSTIINLYFDNGSPAVKTVTGDVTITGTLLIYDDAVVNHATPGTTYSVSSFRLEGTANFQGTVILSGQIYKTVGGAPYTINLANTNLHANGAAYIAANTTLNLGGDLRVLSSPSNYFIINDGSEVIGSGGTLEVQQAARLYMRGLNNFPTGFGTYTIDPLSRIYYDRNGNQTVRGNLSVGRLTLSAGGIKTVDGPLTINDQLDLYNGITAQFGTHTHTIHKRIENSANSSLNTQNGSVINILLKDINANYTFLGAGTYTFRDLNIDTDVMNAARIFTMAANMTVFGDLDMQNTAGNSVSIATLNMGNFQINGGDNWTIGDWLELTTSGANTFNQSVNSFSTSVSASVNSTIWYNGNIDQTIATNVVPYGNLHLSGTGNKTAGSALDVNGEFYHRGGTYTFVPGANTHTFAGRWRFMGDRFSTASNNTVIHFDGADQLIEYYNNNNYGVNKFVSVIFGGTGTKTLQGNFLITRDLTINSGVTVNAENNDVDITIARNFVNNGTFTQDNGTLLFNGNNQAQQITMNAGYIGNLDVQKTGTNQTVTQLTPITVTRQFRLNVTNTNANQWNTGVHNISVGGTFRVELNGIWNQNAASTLVMNGSDTQNMVMYQDITIRNILFQGNGIKFNSTGGGTFGLRVSGNLEITNGATFNAQSRTIFVGGSWTNNGSYANVNGSVSFNGTNQSIGASSFHSIILANAGTKTLAGGITTNASITIDPGVTFDVSNSNNPITCGGNFTNNGIFNSRSGLVTFNGNNTSLNSGGSDFNSINVSKNVGQNLYLQSALVLKQNLTVTSGNLVSGANPITIGGFLDAQSFLNLNNAAATVTFNATGGTHIINVPTSNMRNVVFNAPGATYNLNSTFNFQYNYSLTITDGIVNLNSNTIVLNGVADITINGGELNMNPNSVIRIPNNRNITNNGGVLRIVGSAAQPAVIERQGATGGFTITQTAGTVHAQYYIIRNMITNGFTISGGTIDAVNNFSNGTFTSSTGTQYLNLNGLNFADFSVNNVIFNSGPTYNVTRTSGTGVISFIDPSGTLAGEAYENDAGNRILWSFPGGIYWDGDGDGVSWSDPINWTSNSIPDINSNVVLNHDFEVATYTVNLDAADRAINRLTLDFQSGNPITLAILNGYDLSVTTSVQTSTNTTLSMNDAGSQLSVGENFSISGTLAFTDGTLLLNGITGSHTIGIGNQQLNNLSVNADGVTYSMASSLIINGNVDIQAGLLDVTTGSFDITVGGNWQNVGLNTFNPRSRTVTFNRGGNSTQTIAGGPFYNLVFTNGTGIGTATKQLTANIQVNNDITINANTVFDAQTNNVLLSRHWNNNAATNAFTQTGVGTVFFNGAGNQNIDGGSVATTFNNIELSGGGTVTMLQNSSVNGNFIASFTNGTVDLLENTLTGNGVANTFTLSGTSTLRLRGNNFPVGFETINLNSTSTVQYAANYNANVVATTYGNLTVMRYNAGNPQVKTASGDITVQGNLTIFDTETTFNLNGHTLTLTGNLSVASGAPAIQWGNGTVIHNGGNWYIDTDITELPTVILQGSGTKQLYTNTNITGNLTITNGVRFIMQAFTLTATTPGSVMTMNNGSELRSSIPIGTGVAFPTGFDTYNIASNSLVYLYGYTDKSLPTGFDFGNITVVNGYLNPTRYYLNLTGNTIIQGNFILSDAGLVDAGFSMEIGGADIQLNNYTASVTSTLTLTGTAQTLRESSSNSFALNNLVLSGSGNKTFGDGNDSFTINGNVTINSGTVALWTRPTTMNGASFTINGELNHSANIITFNRAGDQTITVGSVSTFNDLVFSNGGIKNFVGSGTSIRNITINPATTVDFGNGTYVLRYGGAAFINNGTISSSSASFEFTGSYPQIPAMTMVNFTRSTTNNQSTLLGPLVVTGNFTIENGSQFNTGAGNQPVTIGGNVINNNANTVNAFVTNTSTITLNGSVSPVTVQISGRSGSNNNRIYNFVLNPSAPVTYNFTSSDTRVRRELLIESNATVNLGGNNLYVGDNIAGKNVTVNGTLTIPANSTVTLNNYNGPMPFTVNGTLNLVGTGVNTATITAVNSTNTNRTQFSVGATATMAARYYLIEYLDANGLVLTTGATIDPVNNFSDGTFQNMITAGGPAKYYLQTNSVIIPNTIENVNFGFVGTPTVGVHFNVSRTNGASDITFGGSITGNLGGEAYENDPGGNIIWPIPTTSTWTGLFDSDWHKAQNWSTLSVPVATTDVTIPSVANNPIISTADAECKDITITNGALTIQNGYDLDVNGNIIVGTATNAGTLIVQNTATIIKVAGSWTRGTNGIYNNGSSKVEFNAPLGLITITPLNSAFYDIEFTGNATYNYTGTTLNVTRNFVITSGTVNTTTNNYVLNIGGNYTINTGADFTLSTNGTINLNGNNQNITDAKFKNLNVVGAGTKFFAGTNTINGSLVINSTLETTVGASLSITGNVTINNGGTFNDAGGGSHTFSGANWTTVGTGTYTGVGTVTANGGTQVFNDTQFHNLILSGTGVKSLAAAMTISGDMTLETSFTRLDVSTHQITGTPTGVFTVDGTQTIYVLGSNNFPTGFGIYTLSTTSNTEYRGAINQTIRGGIAYGNLNIYNATTKTLSGNTVVRGNLNFNTATLDVSVNNYTLTVGGNWNNNLGGSFIRRLGEVIFNGENSGNQDIRIDVIGTKTFYNITVNKTDGTLRFLDQSHTVGNNFVVSQGKVQIYYGLTLTVSGDFLVSSGTILTSGQINLNASTGPRDISMNGSILNDIVINAPGVTYNLLDNLATNGNFILTAGTFNANGFPVSLGNGIADVLTISGRYIMGSNGSLLLGNDVSFTVNSGGIFEAVGTPGNPVTITRRQTNRYSFQVNGTIHARNYVFEYMNVNGINIDPSGTIDAVNNFSDGTFTNGQNGGTLLRVENTQTLTINNVSFPTLPGGSAKNVSKINSVSGVLTFTNSSGIFAGPVYENDPNNLINWPTPIVLTWIGAVSNDWGTAANWSASSGPNIVPTGAENVVINTAVNQPVISVAGALTNNLTINNGASLTISTPDDIGDDLTINGNLTLTGTLSQTSANDILVVKGSWLRNNSGVFNNGNSIVRFEAAAGSQGINNGNAVFNNVTINATAVYNLQSLIIINGNLTITSGTFDVSPSNFAVTVGGNWSNLGTFNARNGTVTLNRSTAGVATINNSSSVFQSLIINANAAATYQLTNDLSVNGTMTLTGADLELNGNVLNFGDGTGTDVLTVNSGLDVNTSAELRLGNNATLQVESGAVFKLVGTDAVNVATLTRRNTGTYVVNIASGATVHARYYAISYTNANGIQIASGATIDNTNNFSDGTFSNGTTGGRYLSIEGITVNRDLTGVTFNAGPSTNVRGTSGTGNYIKFIDAAGVLAGPTFEDDDGVASTGAVRWESTSLVYTFTAANSNDWHDILNWIDQNNNPAPQIPDNTIEVIIQTGKSVIVSSNNAEATNITIQNGASLTLTNNRNLVIGDNFTSNGTITVADGVSSTIEIGNDIANSGTMNLGNQSTIQLNATTGVKTLAFGASSPFNLTLNGNTTFNLASALIVRGSLTINAGTLDVTPNNYQLTVRGNWTNNGTFTPRSGRVIFDSNSAQSINPGGTAVGKRFYNLRIAKSGNTATFTGNTYIASNFELNSGSVNFGATSIELVGNWNNIGVTVNPATSTVTFSGSVSSLLQPFAQPFYNLTIAKTSSYQVNLNENLTVNGNLNVNSGTLFLNAKNMNFGTGANTITIAGTLYIDGGATLFMHNLSNAVVNNGAILRVTGNNASSRARIAGISNNAGWNMLVNGELRARFATFQHSGGNGITIGATGTLHATDNLSDSRFLNGTGTAYLTLNNNLTATLSNVEFNSSGPTYNVQATDGSLFLDQYSGTFSGARYENDSGPTHPGFIRWNFEQSQSIIGPGSYNFNNEAIIQVTANAGLNAVEVDYRDQLYNNTYNAAYRYYRLTYTGGTATANLTFAYAQNELNTMNENNLKIWVHQGGLEWVRLAASTVNTTDKTITINGYTIGNGTAANTIAKAGKGNENPTILDGSEDFFISDETDQNALPVTLTRFEAKEFSPEKGKVVLEWETETEIENYGFTIQKTYLGFSDDVEKAPVTTDTLWSDLTFVEGHGNSFEKKVYSFEDTDIQQAGKYAYRLQQIDFDGETTIYDPIEVLYAGPEKFDLKQNYPNPFNPSTVIPFDVASRTRVSLEVYNVLGQRIQTLVNEVKNPGTYRVDFNASRLSSGMYIVRFTADGKSFIKKMLLVK